MHGRPARLPEDIALFKPDPVLSKTAREHLQRIILQLEVEIARQNIAEGQDKYKAQQDKRTATMEYNVGDYVWLYTALRRKGVCPKLKHVYRGPYRIVQQTSPMNHKVRPVTGKIKGYDVVHVSRLKCFRIEARPT